MERFLEYWQCALQQKILHSLHPDQVQNYCQKISRAECNAGVSTGLNNGSMVVIPYYAKQQNKYFFPLMLLVDINSNGEFIPHAHLSLPIIPNAVLEPASLCPISLGFAENFANYMAIQPPLWLEDHKLLSWNAQLAYANEILEIANTTWRTDLLQTEYVVQDDALVFPLAKLLETQLPVLQDLNLEILNKPQRIKIIDAQRNSGKSTYAKQLIIDAWIQAAIKQSEPPKFVWLEPGKPIRYASIFACLGVEESVHTNEDMHAKLLTEYEIFTQGQQVVRNWQEFSNRIIEKYADKGGIEARLNQLSANVKEAKVLSRHLQVLYSIWIRQKELLVTWTKAFDFIPLLQKQRLQRLYLFFKQNFPDEVVTGFSLTQLDDLLTEKLRRAENNERMISDALHQVENDLYQTNLVKTKCMQWCEAQSLAMDKVDDYKTVLTRTALLYWQQDFSAKQGYANFLTRQPNEIDLLIAEHAEYIDPIQAADLLSISKRAIVMGKYDAICNARFSVQIDYELTKYFGLSENDADFEDLQFEGVLASLGNMWNMVTNGREADQIFSTIPGTGLHYEYVDVQTSSSTYLGSMVNRGAIIAALEWLNKNATLRSDITIYTCFSGQIEMLKQELCTTFFAQIPIHPIQEPCFSKTAISLFIPVYTQQDPKPYIFDRGSEMLDQLVANTLQRLVVIGDMRIFKPELHSATGNFAKLLFTHKETENKITEEVRCV